MQSEFSSPTSIPLSPLKPGCLCRSEPDMKIPNRLYCSIRNDPDLILLKRSGNPTHHNQCDLDGFPVEAFILIPIRLHFGRLLCVSLTPYFSCYRESFFKTLWVYLVFPFLVYDSHALCMSKGNRISPQCREGTPWKHWSYPQD